MAHDLELVRSYHRNSKHMPYALAKGPGFMDWSNQPNPFRQYAGCRLIPLQKEEHFAETGYEDLFSGRPIPPQPLDRESISWFFFHSLALSAGKRWGQSSWSLRVNPSSGNLHPTEAYLVCPQLPSSGPASSGRGLVAHYAPQHHGLEVLAEPEWPSQLTSWMGIILCSIPWREAWKYGLRSYRYCQLDVGHAIASLAYAAAGLGWKVRLADHLSSQRLSDLLPPLPGGAEAEHPECLLEVGAEVSDITDGVFSIDQLDWIGSPNRLSAEAVSWPEVEEVFSATEKPSTTLRPIPPVIRGQKAQAHRYVQGPPSLSRVIRSRRSAQRLDRSASRLLRDDLFAMLERSMTAPPFSALTWLPLVHLVIFVHQVEGLAPGLYLLARSASEVSTLRSALGEDHLWERPPQSPEGLFCLREGDLRRFCKEASCRQDLASDGCFCLAMLGDMRCLQEEGAWMYPRLFWECGMIGQVLYLEAEAMGLAACGLGCFFDDSVHNMLGLRCPDLADLYHFAVGWAINDPRLVSAPAYPK